MDYELPASFYVGKKFELNGRKLLDDKVLYDAKDLTTHAMCVGMTGSGKTGLCLALLEEAAIDGIPAICIDPKGDLGNLMLAFPELQAKDFEKWIDPDEASRAGQTTADYAAQIADRWRTGLAQWDQPPERINRYRQSVDIAIYTPGSNAGIPLTVLKSFNAPPQPVLDDSEVFRERVAGAASGLLTLMGNNEDPLTSRQHILLSSLFDHAWRQGQNLDLPTLIRSIQSPPMDKVGVFDMETFFPASERMKMAMGLNNLLASPAFAGWLEGQPLDIKSLLYTSQGKPRLSIISIAHLNDSERMFFVTILLNELLSWVRTQPGTSSLRALFYMDEIYGYFPPSAKPPSKPPMLVLLKQARAFGLGIVLATQNPVDLDYKGLANIGTWFLGRLQTQRDKDRIIDGLEGAAAQTGARFDKTAMSEMLAALGSRVFLMNNVHDDGPTVFQSRWVMSYLRGPLSRQQIQQLMDPLRSQLLPDQRPALASKSTSETPTTAPLPAASGSAAITLKSERPLVPHAITERFWVSSRDPDASARRIYRPAVLATAACRYVHAASKLDQYHTRSLLYCYEGQLPEQIWRAAIELPPDSLELAKSPEYDYQYEDIPGTMLNEKSYRQWDKELADELYRQRPIQLFECKQLGRISRPGQDEVDARLSWAQEIRELRDQEKSKLQQKYARQYESLEAKIRAAEQRLEKEKAKYDKEKWNTVLNVGTTVLGRLLGNKVTATRTRMAGRDAARAFEKRSNVGLANETVESLMGQRLELESQCQQELDELSSKYAPQSLTLQPIEVRCRKTDIKVDLLCLVWIPWQINNRGIAVPLVDLGIQ
ncbi:MAG: ATP-binding protein [Pirellulaceae bacterium]|nr:ATP-binding protein [Pirellulaceae bacterium]